MNEHALERHAAAVRQLSNGTNGDDICIRIATVGNTIEIINSPIRERLKRKTELFMQTSRSKRELDVYTDYEKLHQVSKYRYLGIAIDKHFLPIIKAYMKSITIPRYFRESRIKWFKHIKQMEDNRLTKYTQKKKKTVGKPRIKLFGWKREECDVHVET